MNKDGTGQVLNADSPSPLDQDISDSLTISNPGKTNLSIGYDDSTLKLPKIENIELKLWNNAETPEEIKLSRESGVGAFTFNTPSTEGVYIYEALVTYVQGTVSYAMKIEVL